MSDATANYLNLTAQIVAAHIGHNSVRSETLPELIQAVYRTLSTVEAGPAPVAAERPQPAVPVKRSVFPNYIICLEDGKQLKMLKRHLQTSYGMTPAQYRERWGLGADYPMVAPSYAARRSTLAKEIGLGRKPGAAPGEHMEDEHRGGEHRGGEHGKQAEHNEPHGAEAEIPPKRKAGRPRRAAAE